MRDGGRGSPRRGRRRLRHRPQISRGGIASGGEYGDPFLGIVGIRCQHVHGVVLEQPSGGASRAISPESGVSAERQSWITQPCIRPLQLASGLSRRIGLRSGWVIMAVMPRSPSCVKQSVVCCGTL